MIRIGDLSFSWQYWCRKFWIVRAWLNESERDSLSVMSTKNEGLHNSSISDRDGRSQRPVSALLSLFHGKTDSDWRPRTLSLVVVFLPKDVCGGSGSGLI